MDKSRKVFIIENAKRFGVEMTEDAIIVMGWADSAKDARNMVKMAMRIGM